MNVDNKKKEFFILGKGLTQGIGEHSLTSEKKMYSINFTVTRKTFCLNLRYSGANSYLFVNGTEIHKFKANILRDCGNSIMSSNRFKRLVSR